MTAPLTRSLGLAAAPAFALMALLTSLAGSDAMCGTASPGLGAVVGGMTPMYLLMSTFHLAPWLRLLIQKTKRARQGRASQCLNAASASRR